MTSSVRTDSHETVLILDFGSQYSHSIARRLRECKVHSIVLPFDRSLEEIKSIQPKGIILSGGPGSVYEHSAPHTWKQIFELGIPILGICYGLQEIAYQLGGQVARGTKYEYGHAMLTVIEQSDLFRDVPSTFTVWMSHGDLVTELPPSTVPIAKTDNCSFAAIYMKPYLYGLQFHPEVTHTEFGLQILRNFVVHICHCRCDWTMEDFSENAIASIRQRVGSAKVIGAVSGGVDSTVAAVLTSRAIGNQFEAVLVDNGLLRKDEASQVIHRLRDTCGVQLRYVDAASRFLQLLQGVVDPEEKRKVIGKTFVEVFEKEAKSSDASFLLQGTLYPDVIESSSHLGPSVTIKTHHNVGGLPEKMNLKLLEPLRDLFKDEVRELGTLLGIPEESIYRHPFPGPGLAIRIIGQVDEQRLEILRHADSIYIEELKRANLYRCISQAFAVLLPVKAVGVMGDSRSYEDVIALRAVETVDYMTARWYSIPSSVLERVSSRIVNEVNGVNRVVYDITSKPPATIEWE
ncbi:GMP synthase (glutamine-hydrolyzing) [Galdieria sulphuraria]|uniref:GMP synthase [glutamine-hydrolyzing] n=1 Tax=Galdieria sulphuraria TaxID=130081 RepID=M2XBN7_GALSU|nr:GMP synthase (glutamine-hydrolyzing) [Galdieria sulphuraria]EME27302.1 GMP synthase (glutamine-hydrolysing) [Galdieria sulphuraria]|eukprot:XP_005703822.1 GMP synthase (glutamine-hydrolysing) [Galdieria sulphuraria]